MQALPEHKYIRLDESSKIIPLVIKRDQYGKTIGDSVYRDLNKILNEEFLGAAAGHLSDRGRNRDEQEVILFPTEDDCTAFLLKYGHIYGKMA
jgi:hypothetical protein